MQGLPEVIRLDDIRRTTLRIPFSENELAMLHATLVQGRNKGRDHHFGTMDTPFKANEIEEVMQDGVVLLASPHMVQQDFMFVKCDAGRSFFGGQTAVYRFFVGEAGRDEWMPGATFKTWLRAITSLGNVYRGNGFA